MEQKVIITESESTINNWLSRGWRVVSVTPQHVSSFGQYGSLVSYGKFCFVIEKAQ